MRESKSKPEYAEGAEVTGAPRGLRSNQMTELIIGAAIEVHRVTGPGLMESVYEECLCYELSQRGLGFQRQVELPVAYKGIKLNCGLRMDLLVEDAVVLELKTVDQLLPVHSAQLLTYLKLSGKKVGLLINFNERVLTRGLRRLVNHFREPGETPVTSAPSAFSDFAFLKSLRFCVSAVNKQRGPNHFPKPGATPVTSAPSAFSDFAFLKSLRLCVSAVNKQRVPNHFPKPGATPVTSGPSAFSDFAFLKSLRLCVSAVNKQRVPNHFPKPGATPVTSAPSAFSDFAFFKSLRLCGEQIKCSSAS